MARHHVCNIVKHKDEYPEFQLQRTRISPLRCKNCMHCPGCNKEKKADSLMETQRLVSLVARSGLVNLAAKTF